MKFSLILATLGRTTELGHFLESLDRQTFRDFELIIVDQNPDDRLAPIIAPYASRFEIVHLRAAPGLSSARNAGLAVISGDVVGFPDDDCWYLPSLLERVVTSFASHPDADGFTAPCIDDRGVILRRGPKSPGWLTKYNLFRRTYSVTMFFRRKRIANLGGFDETLGVGAGTPWNSAEDHDYAVRALMAGLRIYYDPALGVCHPDAPHSFDEHEIRKERAYARGCGRFLRKHKYSRFYIGYRIVRALGGAVLGVMRADNAKVRYHLQGVMGKLEGWVARA